jgi:hypothetical protein
MGPKRREARVTGKRGVSLGGRVTVVGRESGRITHVTVQLFEPSKFTRQMNPKKKATQKRVAV